jgi:putative protein-disulfide isomerase
MTNPECDTETGVCEIPSLEDDQNKGKASVLRSEVVYVGDPMCSWCWGIAPALGELQAFCQKLNLSFRVVVGGLRPGGGEPWNQQFTQFLSHHWQEVSKRSGQPFNDSIFSWESFNYDTEPSCRSIVAARQIGNGIDLGFFAAVQRKFYVDNEDPNQPEFYRSICDEFGLDFDEFLPLFESETARAQTIGDFQLSRSWGVNGFPSILMLKDDRVIKITSGYSSFEKMRAIIESELA